MDFISKEHLEKLMMDKRYGKDKNFVAIVELIFSLQYLPHSTKAALNQVIKFAQKEATHV